MWRVHSPLRWPTVRWTRSSPDSPICPKTLYSWSPDSAHERLCTLSTDSGTRRRGWCCSEPRVVEWSNWIRAKSLRPTSAFPAKTAVKQHDNSHENINAIFIYFSLLFLSSSNTEYTTDLLHVHLMGQQHSEQMSVFLGCDMFVFLAAERQFQQQVALRFALAFLL